MSQLARQQMKIAPPTVCVIRPPRWLEWPDLRELWRSRGTAWSLVVRDLRVRYKQTTLGFLWALISPFVTMVVFSLIFGSLLHVPTNGVPYPIFVFSALLVWRLFEAILNGCCKSLVVNQSLFTKLYFPRLLLPLTPIIPALVDFVISLIILFGLMAWYGIGLEWRILSLPLWVGLAVLTGLALGIWAAVLNAMYRDVQFIVPYMVGVLLFLTPVVYSQQTVQDRFAPGLLVLYELNPMVAVIDGARWAVVPGWEPPGVNALVSTALMVLVLVGGALFFARAEQNIVDVV